MTDAELIPKIFAGDDRMFSHLVERYTGMVWAVCTSYVTNRTECEDLVQEVFITCYQNLDKLREQRAFGRWLSQIARKRSLNWLRSLKRRREAVSNYEESAKVYNEGAKPMEEIIQQADLYRSLRQLVDTLPPRTREVMLMYYSEGCSIREVAEFLGVTNDAVKKRLRAGRDMLKEKATAELGVALAPRKHEPELKQKVLAAIPFGQAAWLTGTVTTSALTKAAVTGGATAMLKKTVVTGSMTIMLKKMILGIVAAALILCGGTLLMKRVFSPDREGKGAFQTAGKIRSSLPSERTIKRLFPAPAEAAAAPAPQEEPLSTTESAAEDLRPASVSGRVTDDAGYPVAGASIFLDVTDGEEGSPVRATYEATTGTMGSFALGNISEFGQGQIFAQAQGYGIRQMNVTFPLRPGDAIENVTLMLSRSAHFITGTVSDDRGKPISRAQIHIRGFGYTEKGVQKAIDEESPHVGGTESNSRTLGYTFSADDGYFELGVPRGGLCDISVNKEGYASALFTRIPTGTRDMRLVLEEGGAISGRVARTDGSSVADVQVLVEGWGYPGGLEPVDYFGQNIPMVRVHCVTNGEGRYRAERLGADLYYAVSIADAEALGGDAPPKAGIRVANGKTTGDVDFVLRPRARIYGSLTNVDNGAPVPLVGVKAAVVASGSTPECLLGETKTDENGHYEMELAIEPQANVRLSAVLFLSHGDMATIDGGPAVLVLQPGEEKRVDLSIVAPITIPIRVIDEAGDPKPDVDLMIHRITVGDSWWPGWVKTGEDGRYIWRGLGADTYVIEAVDPSRSGGSSIIGRGGPVSGEPGETTDEVVIVCAVEEGGIEGVLVAPDGTVRANTRVGCGGVRDGQLYALKSGWTDDDGYFCILYSLPTGTYSRVCLGSMNENGRLGVALIEDVDIEKDAVTDLGEMRLEHEFETDQEAVAFILSES